MRQSYLVILLNTLNNNSKLKCNSYNNYHKMKT